MNATILTPAQLLASEPAYSRGVKSQFRPEADRTITYTWELGEGVDRFGDACHFRVELHVTHSNRALRANLWRMEGGGMVIDGSNGRRIVSEPAARYSAAKLQPFAEHALRVMRTVFGENPMVLGYFDLTVVKP